MYHSQMYMIWWHVLINVVHKLIGKTHLQISSSWVTQSTLSSIEGLPNSNNVTVKVAWCLIFQINNLHPLPQLNKSSLFEKPTKISNSLFNFYFISNHHVLISLKNYCHHSYRIVLKSLLLMRPLAVYLI